VPGGTQLCGTKNFLPAGDGEARFKLSKRHHVIFVPTFAQGKNSWTSAWASAGCGHTGVTVLDSRHRANGTPLLATPYNAMKLADDPVEPLMRRNIGVGWKTSRPPTSALEKSQGDKALGMEQDITRRDFLNATLLASGGLLLTSTAPAQLLAKAAANPAASPVIDDWTGYGGVGDYANSNGNTTAVLEAGHQIRDGAFETLPASVIDTGEIYDCVVVGGGISGLAAALIFQRKAGKGKTCLVLDNHPIFGGEAKRNEFLVDGHRLIGHQGSALFQVNYPHSFIERFYESIGSRRRASNTRSGPGPIRRFR
jgi:hypothetical protein